MIDSIALYNEECLEGMSRISSHSVDMILCDLPYGVTARNHWDQVIPFEPQWAQYDRLIEPHGAIVLFGQGLFSARLILSNEKLYRYSLVWDKSLPTGFLNAKRMPLRAHEDIHVFYKKLPVYHPQMHEGKPSHSKGKAVGKLSNRHQNNNYRDYIVVETEGSMKHPVSILRFARPHPSVCVHPTQKPVELLEWLIRSYISEGETVLDNCMGSGSTAIACMNTGRRFIGFEMDERYFETARRRINQHIEEERR